MRPIVVAAARVVGVIALVLAMFTVRVVWSSRVELGEAESQAMAGDAVMALDHYGRAARLYAPGNPYSSRATAKLAAGCQESDSGKPEEVLAACRELRSSILATRSFYTPHRDLLVHANDLIARLSARLESPSLDPTADEAARARWHALQLARDDAPSVCYSLLAITGLLSWIGCAVGFFLAGLDEHNRPRRPAGYLWAAGIVVGFSLFLMGLARA